METSQKIVPFKKRLCRYFFTSTCYDGNRCLFSHDRNTSDVADNICRLYLKRRCIYGSKCKFEHVTKRQIECDWQDIVESSSSKAGTTLCFNSQASMEHSQLNPVGNSHAVKDTNNGCNSSRLSVTSLDVAVETVTCDKRDNSAQTESEDTLSVVMESSLDNSILGEPSTPLSNASSSNASPSSASSSNASPSSASSSNASPSSASPSSVSPSSSGINEAYVEEGMRKSMGKTCSICFDVIIEKTQFSQRRFGILEKCNHVFCVSCIRRWRQVQAHNSIARKCPECRIFSNFFIPNLYWIEGKEEKEQLIAKFREKLSWTPCKFFRQGQGYCMNRGSCFYLHAYPDGTRAVLPPRGESLETISVTDSDELEIISFDGLDDIFTADDENIFGIDMSAISNLVYTLLTEGVQNQSNETEEQNGEEQDDEEQNEQDDEGNGEHEEREEHSRQQHRRGRRGANERKRARRGE